MFFGCCIRKWAYGGAFVYASKNQSINAFSSTESDIIYDVTDTKTARFLRYMIR